jgi:tRNA(Ile)-lysidine synthase
MNSRVKVRWPAAAAGLGDLVGKGRLHPSVAEWADARPKAERWAVALSGGADSVGLLLLIWAHWPARRDRLTAFHFDHRLRGAASTADARFCGKVCAALSIPLVSGRWVASRRMRSEAAARRARFEFIEREMTKKCTRVLWLGHQQDDIAETMLMRLSRGSGTAGLAAPRPIHEIAPIGGADRSIFHIRPLLTLKKKEIAGALASAGASWREDSSNAKGAHFRNRVRSDVIPRWVRASQRDAMAGAALSRELLEEDTRAIDAWVDLLAPIGSDHSLNVVGLRGRPRAVVRRALHRWLLLQTRAGDQSRQGFEVLLRSVERGAPIRHSLGNHGFAVIRAGRLRFQASAKPRTLH